MKALIIEDETIAAQNLQRLVGQVAPDIEVVGVIQSVEETVEYFSEQPMPNLVFMDIHLADGLAFHIFESVTITCPVIFTTAYDQYALDAFKVNSIDYLLKPISSNDLERAVAKLRHLVHAGDGSSISPATLANLMEQMQPHRYKSHFLIPYREKLIPLPVDSIAFVYVDEKMTHAVTYDQKSHTIDKPLDTIFAQLDPRLFFRANRQYIIARAAVKDITLWPLSKLHISLTVPTPDKIIISRARTSEFKEWFTN